MSRTDRLHDLIDLLRDGRLHRAGDLAGTLGVTKRTVYRDIDVLRASGLPIEGTRGVGYQLSETVTLPPLSLTPLELEALQLGLAVLADAADEDLSNAARSLTAKLETGPEGTGERFAVPPVAPARAGLGHLPALRAAIRARQKLRIETAGEALDLRPLDIEFRGRAWVLIAWTRGGFRLIRTDAITALEALPELFVDEPGKTLGDFAVTGHSS